MSAPEESTPPLPALPDDPSATFPRIAARTPFPFETSREAWVTESLVARGGFAEVWRARQVALDRTVAIKALRPDAAADSEGGADPAAQLLAEGLVAARLDHPNIVPVYDIVRGVDGRPQLAMKLVQGRPWSELLAEGDAGGDRLEEHLGILQQVAQAVAFAHSRGVVHADLKPQQVVVGDFGEVFLMDWGLALQVPVEGVAPSPYLPTPATARAPAGTPSYMAPEQTRPTAEGVGTWTDVYLLGGILHHILCGRPPHYAASSAQAFYMAHRGRVVPLREAAPGRAFPPELEALAAAALDPDPARRPASAAEFLARIRDFRSGATRRREAADSCARAAGMLRVAKDYSGFAECLAELDRARSLWSGEPRIAPLSEEALRGYAEAALANGDYVLARAQADRMAPAAAAPVHARIALLSAARSRRERQRKLLAAASAALLIGVGTLSTALYITQRRANEELLARQRRIEEARARAERARGDAEGLLDYMLTDLRARLVPIGQVSVLEGVSARAVGYYAALPTDDRTEGARANHAAAHVHHSEVLRLLGRTAEARAAVASAIALARADPALPQALASALDRLGDLEIQLSEWEAANAAFAECADVLRAQPQADERELAVALTKQAHALRELGRLAEARAAAADARAIRERIAAAAGPAEDTPLRDLLSIYAMCGRIEELAGDTEAARRDFDAALATIAKLRALAPEDWMLERNATVLAANIGDLLYGEGRHGDAQREYARALESSARMIAHDADNAEWAYIHSWNLKRACWAAEQLGDFEAALATAEEARTHACAWAAREPRDLRFLHECALAHDTIGYDAHGLGRVTEALAAHVEAASRWEALRAEDAARVAMPEASNAFWHARALALSGNRDAAAARFRAGLAAAEGHAEATRHLLAREPVLALALGDEGKAAELLQQCIAEGTLDAAIFADADFAPVRTSEAEAVRAAVAPLAEAAR